MAYRIEADADACLSSGRCVAEAPELFRFDADEIVELVPDAPAPPDEVLLGIARACPAGALRLFDGAAEVEL